MTDDTDGPRLPMMCDDPAAFRDEQVRRKAAERERDELALQAERLIGENEQTRANLAEMARQLEEAEREAVDAQQSELAIADRFNKLHDRLAATTERLSRAEAERARLEEKLLARMNWAERAEYAHDKARMSAAAQPVARGPEVELTDNAAACNCIAARLMPRQLAGSHHILDEAGVSEGEVGGRLSGARLNERIRFLIDQVRHCETQVMLAGTPAAPPVRDESKPPPGWQLCSNNFPDKEPWVYRYQATCTLSEAWALHDRDYAGKPSGAPVDEAAVRADERSCWALAAREEADFHMRIPTEASQRAAAALKGLASAMEADALDTYAKFHNNRRPRTSGPTPEGADR